LPGTTQLTSWYVIASLNLPNDTSYKCSQKAIISRKNSSGVVPANKSGSAISNLIRLLWPVSRSD